MSNHLHLVATAKNNDLSDLIRDFKKHTSKEIIRTVENNAKESRRKWMLDIFSNAGNNNSRNTTFQFWQQGNRPQELYSSSFIFQKINYIHNNPVRAGIVENPHEYFYSSARDYFYEKKCGLLDIDFLW
jgi:REP element-mobilizing transposase RayT